MHTSGSPNELSVAAGTTITFTWTETHNVYEVPDRRPLTTATSLAATELALDIGSNRGRGGARQRRRPGTSCVRWALTATSGQKIAITWAAAPTPAPVASADAPTPRPSVAATPAPTNSSSTDTNAHHNSLHDDASAATPAPVASAQTQSRPTPRL